MKNVNDVDFDTNINRDMCMKVNVMFIFIDIKLRIVDKYIYLYHAYCYLHHVCAYVYVDVYADDNGYVYKYLCMYGLENEK